MRAAVEDDAAVGTEEVCEAGRLPALFGRCCGNGQVLVAEAAVERRSESFSPTLGLDDPGSQLEQRPVAQVLLMAAGELGNPVAVRVLVVTDDSTLHLGRVPSGSKTGPFAGLRAFRRFAPGKRRRERSQSADQSANAVP